MPFKDKPEGQTNWYHLCTRCKKDDLASRTRFTETEAFCRECQKLEKEEKK